MILNYRGDDQVVEALRAQLEAVDQKNDLDRENMHIITSIGGFNALVQNRTFLDVVRYDEDRNRTFHGASIHETRYTDDILIGYGNSQDGYVNPTPDQLENIIETNTVLERTHVKDTQQTIINCYSRIPVSYDNLGVYHIDVEMLINADEIRSVDVPEPHKLRERHPISVGEKTVEAERKMSVTDEAVVESDLDIINHSKTQCKRKVKEILTHAVYDGNEEEIMADVTYWTRNGELLTEKEFNELYSGFGVIQYWFDRIHNILTQESFELCIGSYNGNQIRKVFKRSIL